MSNKVGKKNLTQAFKNIDPSELQDVEIIENFYGKQRLVIHTEVPKDTRPKHEKKWNTRVMP